MLAALPGTWHLLSAPLLCRWNAAGKSRGPRPTTIAAPLSWRISARRWWSSLWRGSGSARRICKWNRRDENEDFFKEGRFLRRWFAWSWKSNNGVPASVWDRCDFERRIYDILEIYIIYWEVYMIQVKVLTGNCVVIKLFFSGLYILISGLVVCKWNVIVRIKPFSLQLL